MPVQVPHYIAWVCFCCAQPSARYLDSTLQDSLVWLACMPLQVPYYNAWVNALRTGFYSVHAWVCIVLVILVYRVPSKVVSVLL